MKSTIKSVFHFLLFEKVGLILSLLLSILIIKSLVPLFQLQPLSGITNIGHYHFLEQMIANLRNGQWYGYDVKQFFGYGLFTTYPPLNYLIPAIIYFVSPMTVIASYHLYLLLLILTHISSFIWLCHRGFGISIHLALAIYTLLHFSPLPMHLLGIGVQGIFTTGFHAMILSQVFLFLSIGLLHSLLQKAESSNRDVGSIIALALCTAALLYSHFLSCMVFAFYVIIAIVSRWKSVAWKKLFIAAALCLLLMSPYLIILYNHLPFSSSFPFYYPEWLNLKIYQVFFYSMSLASLTQLNWWPINCVGGLFLTLAILGAFNCQRTIFTPLVLSISATVIIYYSEMMALALPHSIFYYRLLAYIIYFYGIFLAFGLERFTRDQKKRRIYTCSILLIGGLISSRAALDCRFQKSEHICFKGNIQHYSLSDEATALEKAIIANKRRYILEENWKHNSQLGSSKRLFTKPVLDSDIQAFPGIFHQSSTLWPFVLALSARDSEMMSAGKPLFAPAQQGLTTLSAEQIIDRLAYMGSESIVTTSTKFKNKLESDYSAYLENVYSSEHFSINNLKSRFLSRNHVIRLGYRPYLLLKESDWDFFQFNSLWLVHDLLETPVFYSPLAIDQLDPKILEQFAGFIIVDQTEGKMHEKERAISELNKQNRKVIVISDKLRQRGELTIKSDQWPKLKQHLQSDPIVPTKSVDLQLSHNKMTIEAEGPVVLQYGYSPGWKATSPIFLASPALIGIIATGKLELYFK